MSTMPVPACSYCEGEQFEGHECEHCGRRWLTESMKTVTLADAANAAILRVIDLCPPGVAVLAAARGWLTINAVEARTSRPMQVAARVPCRARFAPVPVDLRDLARALEAIPTATFSVGPQVFSIRGTETLIELPTTVAPATGKIPRIAMVPLPADATRAAVNRVLPFAPPTDNRYGIHGVNVEHHAGVTRFVATDGNRLAYSDVVGAAACPPGWIVPVPFLRTLSKALATYTGSTVELGLEGEIVGATVGNVRLFARLVRAAFPDWKQVVPSTFKRRVVADRDALARVVRTAGTFPTATSDQTIWRIGDITTVERHTHAARVYASLTVELTGDLITVGMNAGFVLDALACAPPGPVCLELNNALDPIRVTSPADPSFAVILSPQRVD